MKGLLLKDWYNLRRYCRSLLLIDLVFILAGVFQRENVFFAAYPMLFAGVVPLTLFSYDERDKWDLYGGILPVSSAAMVSVKYILGLLSLGAALSLTLFVRALAGTVLHLGRAEELPLVLGACAMGLLLPALSLPLFFRYGAEKARILYFFLIGGFCAGSFVLGKQWLPPAAAGRSPLPALLPCLVLVTALALYLLSWLLSMAIYRRREF